MKKILKPLFDFIMLGCAAYGVYGWAKQFEEDCK